MITHLLDSPEFSKVHGKLYGKCKSNGKAAFKKNPVRSPMPIVKYRKIDSFIFITKYRSNNFKIELEGYTGNVPQLDFLRMFERKHIPLTDRIAENAGYSNFTDLYAPSPDTRPRWSTNNLKYYIPEYITFVPYILNKEKDEDIDFSNCGEVIEHCYQKSLLVNPRVWSIQERYFSNTVSEEERVVLMEEYLKIWSDRQYSPYSPLIPPDKNDNIIKMKTLLSPEQKQAVASLAIEILAKNPTQTPRKAIRMAYDLENELEILNGELVEAPIQNPESGNNIDTKKDSTIEPISKKTKSKKTKWRGKNHTYDALIKIVAELVETDTSLSNLPIVTRLMISRLYNSVSLTDQALRLTQIEKLSKDDRNIIEVLARAEGILNENRKGTGKRKRKPVVHFTNILNKIMEDCYNLATVI